LWVWGASFVSCVFVGFVGGLPLFFGFHGAYLWARWVVPVYTSCILRGALCFFNKIFLLIIKKKKKKKKKKKIKTNHNQKKKQKTKQKKTNTTTTQPQPQNEQSYETYPTPS
jgi:phosphotransferase system  glucose/maltose/N-acetylglucosamine-specific IIC component